MEQRALPFLRAIWLFFLLLALPANLPAAEFRLISDTLLRGFERDTAGGGEDVVVPVYEYLQADVGREGERPLTFHLYGWGRIDLAGSDYFEERFAGGDDAAGELLYGYLQYDHPGTSLTARLGRLSVFEGVANESVDGVHFATGLGKWFSASAYGGWPVALDSTEGRSGDSIYGGRLAHHRPGLYEVGVSYKSVDNDGDQAEERLGFDLSLLLPAGVSVYGTSERNLETDGWAAHFYEARFSLGSFQFRPFFEHYRYEDFFDAGEKTGRAFVFLPGLDETLSVVGADVLWPMGEKWEWGVKAKYLDFDERDDAAQFLSGLAIWHGEGLTQAGGELGRMQGDRDDDRYVLGRAFVYCDRPKDRLLKFHTADVVLAWYDEKINDESMSLFVSVGTGTRLLADALELKVSADYSNDPYFDHDLRGWLLARYAFSL